MYGGNVALNSAPVEYSNTIKPTYWINSDGSTNPPKWFGGKRSRWSKINTKKRNSKKIRYQDASKQNCMFF